MGLFGGGKDDWLDAEATVLAEDPKGGVSGDTKHGRYYWKKNELELSLRLPTGATETVRWKGNVPQSICYSMRGRTLPVKVHPAKHDKLEFDWDEIVGWHKLADAPGTATVVGAQEAEQQGVRVEQIAGGVRITREETPADPLDRIEKLGRLREQGLITEAEFEAQKAKLLGET